MFKKLLLFVLIIVLLFCSNLIAGTQSENRINLELDIEKLLKSNYLLKQSSLQDNMTWLSIELKGNTWKNPNDTKALADSVLVYVKKNMPLNIETRLFKVYIDEPISGFPIAEITITNNNIEPITNTYNKYQQAGKEKVYGSSKTRKISTSGYNAILKVPNTNAVLIAIDENAYRDFTRASTRSDYDLLYKLIGAGKLIETNNNIKIKIIEYGIIKHKVKILEGMNSGSVGWIATEFVKKK